MPTSWTCPRNKPTALRFVSGPNLRFGPSRAQGLPGWRPDHQEEDDERASVGTTVITNLDVFAGEGGVQRPRAGV
jgi:hypothetical protein